MVEHPDRFWRTFSYIRLYRPYWKGKNPAFEKKTDGRTLDLKVGKWDGIKAAIPEFSAALAELKIPAEAILVMVPGHTARRTNAGTAMGRVIDGILAANPPGKYVDGKDTLIRRVTVPKKTHGGPRDFQAEVDSIAATIIGNLLRDRVIVILDDVATTGTSIAASRSLLARCAPRDIGALVLGKTV